MSRLLRKYYGTEKKFRTKKVLNLYTDTLEWSKALNEELEKILSEMDSVDLCHLLENTQGMYRMVIKKYLDEARKRESMCSREKEITNDLVATIAG